MRLKARTPLPTSPRRWARRIRPLGALVVAAASALALTGGAGSAGADTTSPTWTCRGSAAYINFGSSDRIEPIVANGNTRTSFESPDRAQCVDDDAGVPNISGGDPEGSQLVLQVPFARTRLDCAPAPPCESNDIGPAANQTVSAAGGAIEPVTAQLGSPDGLVVTTRDARSGAAATCKDGVPTLTGDSTVSNVTLVLGGQEIPIEPISGEPNQVIDLSPLAKVTFNERIEEGTSTSPDQALTVRAVHVEVFPSPPDQPAINLVVGESKVDRHGDVCNAGGGTGGGGGGAGDNAQPCPPGAEYDQPRNLCIIRDPGGGGQAAQTIIVGRPYQGPSGGRVISLRIARERYGRSPCVKGGGPRFVIIGTNRRDRITGTNRSDRILLFGGNDHSEGGRGHDCFDGGSGRDTLSGALGRDRIYGFAGGDHLIGGSHSDYLSSSTGNDTINTGFGRDTVIAGSGRDYINSGTAGPAARRLDCGSGPDKLRINRNERRRWRGCEIVHVFR
jgi:Ca2+-binding RTX toxin-like protein